METAYPFGFGLSYTRFDYEDLKLSGSEFTGELFATVTIQNAGTAAGREVVQLYVSAPGKGAPKPALELRAFAKTRTLQPGESQALGFRLTGRELASFDEATSSWLAEAGSYSLKVGASSTDIRQSAGFVLTRPRTVDSVAASIGSLGAR